MTDRIVVRADPLNAETPLERQEGTLTATGRHYVRSHFTTPLPQERVSVGGLVLRPQSVTLAQVRALPSHSLAVTLECAGNGRRFLEPETPGEQWGLGAASTARWTGARLSDLLALAGIGPGAREVLARGADRGAPDARGEISFERSLPLGAALGPDVLVAYEMNEAPLPSEHGAPLRLVVPGMYGVASVKWLAAIEVIAEPFHGFYQSERYVIDGQPLGRIPPRAVIVAPGEGVTLPSGTTRVRGLAWSGEAPIAAVDVSFDGGSAWRPAFLGPAPSAYAWREWTIEWNAEPGEHRILARATDASGHRQPLAQVWNALGYANNAAVPRRVRVRD